MQINLVELFVIHSIISFNCTSYWKGLTIPEIVVSNRGKGIRSAIGSSEKGIVKSTTKDRGYVTDKAVATRSISYFYKIQI